MENKQLQDKQRNKQKIAAQHVYCLLPVNPPSSSHTHELRDSCGRGGRCGGGDKGRGGGEAAGRGHCLHSFVVAVCSPSELQVEPPTPLGRYIIPPQTKTPWFYWWGRERGGAEDERGRKGAWHAGPQQGSLRSSERADTPQS